MIVRITCAKVGHRQAPTKTNAPPNLSGAFVFVRFPDDPLLSERQHAAIPICSVPRSGFFTGFDHLDDDSRGLLRRRLTQLPQFEG